VLDTVSVAADQPAKRQKVGGEAVTTTGAAEASVAAADIEIVFISDSSSGYESAESHE
jgi:hypothetical protein